jgi:protein phosphatase
MPISKDERASRIEASEEQRKIVASAKFKKLVDAVAQREEEALTESEKSGEPSAAELEESTEAVIPKEEEVTNELEESGESPAKLEEAVEIITTEKEETEETEQTEKIGEFPTDELEEPIEVAIPEKQENLTELEEQVEPLPELSLPEPLTADTAIAAPDGKLFRIVEWLRSESQTNLYAAIGEDGHSVWLREAFSETDTAAQFLHEEKVLQGLNCPMFPQVGGCFESNGKTYLITEEISTQRSTLADLLRNKERKLPDILSVLAQVAFGLTQLHTHGWVHLGLRPTHIILGKPVKILDGSYATRIGEKPAATFSHAGYSPPELQSPEPVDARADIYGLGALLYQAVKGETIPETGPELTLLPPMAGVKQILSHCLGERDSRYQTMADLHLDLLRLKRRLETTVSYSVAAATTIGLESTRTTNQDAHAYLSGHLTSEQGEQQWVVACVADGMGGMAAGELASEVAVKVVLREAAAAFTQSHEVSVAAQMEWVKHWVHKANQDVCAAMERHQAKGGCTLSCACLVNQRLAIAHVGDCRIYRFRKSEVKPLLLTRDHSLVMARVLQGELKLEEVRNHPDRSMINRSLGERHPLPDYYIDTLETATSQPVMDLQVGDVLLLCSDGLWEPVLEAEMFQVVQDYASNLQAMANALLKIALQRGAPDNATVVLLRLDESDVPKEG